MVNQNETEVKNSIAQETNYFPINELFSGSKCKFRFVKKITKGDSHF